MAEPPMSFDQAGLLPPGDYRLTFDELRESLLVMGDSTTTCWDLAWRGHLADQLEILTRQLWSVGVERVFADGSFVEDKAHPNDIDGYFEVSRDRLASGELERQLNRLDPLRCWTWDPSQRRTYRSYSKAQLPMWHHYRVELYPHVTGMGCGIHDERGRELDFPSAFRRSRRSGQPRGIIELRRSA